MKNILNLILAVLAVTSLVLKADDPILSGTPTTTTVKKVAKAAPSQPVPVGTASVSSPTDPKTIASLADPSIAPPAINTRYGVFDALDKRSVYGQGAFPEPFLVDDSDGEVDEGRLDWLHTGGPGNQHADNVHGELEKGFGLLTLELETAYKHDSSSGKIAEGMDNIDLGARHPFYQYVSSDGGIDNTVGLALEVVRIWLLKASQNR